ncbi:SWI/SNF-related matrix-associated actin-dependent regulator of chromatin subfamily A containing DEAD/H box 1 [Tetranychus urticae]|uniref:SWI/SNF-related matrix-associated actin-dependent regulator of chromatin subfamily A containing DEAD/H box 1 homolog n=1 Tax=Tetranychus urticae TaxID=32264 RepID=T1L0P1_TETUR|nr:SWI/SNF-related matrix-associated actin-dependent regulator of chromatin subfamily A containing DEAD/H box 1 [Tetranychus urticae]
MKLINMSSDEEESLSALPRRSNTKRRIMSSDESDSESIEVISSHFAKGNPAKGRRARTPSKKIRTVNLSDSEESDQEKSDESKIYEEKDSDYDDSNLSGPSPVVDISEEENFLASSSDEELVQKSPSAPDLDDDEDYDDLVGESSEDEEEAIIQLGIDSGKMSLRAQVLSYLEDASENDLLHIPGVSKKKAQNIIKLRPFANWMDLVTKIKCDRSLSLDLIEDCKEIVKSHQAISRLMSECEKISEKMGETVAKIEPAIQPNILNRSMTLTNYQLIGLNWLVLLYKRNINGILADEMGLGKTIQVIALLAYLREHLNNKGPHLIVVPSSTLENWQREFETWCSSIRVVVYHGSMDFRAHLRASLGSKKEKFDVLLTTYNLVSSADDKRFLKRLPLQYIIFDEAHMLKNMKSNRFSNLISLTAKRRLLLTGTPVQNNLLELMSLLFFTMPSFFSSKLTHIQNLFASKNRRDGETTFEKDRVDQAKRILKPFVLRRLKIDVLKQLPSKTEHIKSCPMEAQQELTYMELVENYTREIRYSGKNIFENIVESDENLCKLRRGAGMLMELRKAANHPLLLRRHYNADKLREMARLMLTEPTHADANVDYVYEDMEVMTDYELHRLCNNFKSLKDFRLSSEFILTSGKFKVLDELLPFFKEKNQRVLIFSQFTMMLDIMEEYLKIRKHEFLRLDGQTKVSDRLNLIDQFTDDTKIFVFLLSTRAGGLGINLTSANVVIIHDIDFNPYNDKQAEDRCHRVGQDAPVEIYRLISENSVEEGILKICDEKLKLGQDIYVKNGKNHARDDSKDLKTLLRRTLGI